ncbi:ribonuclease [Streptomyces sp. Vc74B-19]|uniref:ribonuclease domain-containing protein n=1 Tax=unclassified Streptomyces TaxID=2593676 RepID=UPI001BFCD3C7|nr:MULTISPECIES: ribonuclease domain-containing protein [unclassified Streptomyces]MBT3165319.1 ribonuclease [Streptomyces sp. Vc74B-19]MCO4694432.1 ribonuclease [Streptomyces sp. RO-S4]MDU0300673.1 ribonuclease domain-containing protein [Streptomyces sp. PAL114]
MRFPPRAARSGAAAALLSVLVLGGGGALAAPAAHAAPAAPVAAASVLAVGDICASDLPAEAHDTLDLIDQGGPFPFEQDGTVFQNREGILPDRSSGYYHEYTVITPGSPTRGARRIVTGEEYQEDYYTADHYASFDLVDHTC